MLQANMFIGLGLLSTAYALKLGGWMALLGLTANAACFATAGEHNCKDLSDLALHASLSVDCK
jgi:amino acid permease